MKNFFTFVTGLVIGSVVTYVVVKDKFEKITQEEIDSVKEVFGRRVEKEADKKIEKIAEKEVEKIRKEYNDYGSLTKNYTSYSKNETKEDDCAKVEDDDDDDDDDCAQVEDEDGVELFEVERASDSDRPYVIDPWDFGGEEGYDTVTLIYYADDVLTDSDNNVIEDEDIDDFVGADFAEHFGEYEKDCVCVRNDRLKIDYEICRDIIKYSTLLLNPNH